MVDIFDASIHLPQESWQRFHRLKEVDATVLSRARCRFFLKHSRWTSPKDWAVMEGLNFAKRPRAKVFRFGELSGFGAPLTLMPGPYSADPLSKTLACSVVQHGQVVDFAREDRHWTMRLNRPLTADEEHRVVFWSSTGELATLTPDALGRCDGVTWEGGLPRGFNADEPLAVGLAFRGTVLGSWWERTFSVPRLEQEFRRTAALLRWFRLPLLADAWLEEARNFTHQRALSCLLAWVLDRRVEGSPELVLPGESEAWFGAVRQVFRGWNPQPQEAHAVWRGLSVEMDPQPLLGLLLQVDPAIALKLLTRGPFSIGEMKCFHSWVSLSKSREDLAKDAARDMQVADYYLPLRLCEKFLKNQLDENGRRFFDIAIQVGSFSRLLTAMFLEDHLEKKREKV